MQLDFKVAVLGAGKLGGALLAGLVRADVIAPERLRATVGSAERADELRRAYGIRVSAEGSSEVAAWADVVILSVKPAAVPALLEEIRAALRPDQILVSLAAAVPLKLIESRLARPMAVFRAMPNLAMRVRQSATAICANALARDHERHRIEQLFAQLGTVVLVEQERMDVVTGLCGSGPAYVYLLMEALAAGGGQAGLSGETASALARQTVFGAAALVEETGLDARALRSQVTTPGGTTAAGLAVLEEHHFTAVVAAAVEAAARRARELTDELSGA